MSELSEQNKKANASNDFDGLINEAMDDISNKKASSATSFQMPVEILYLMILLLILSFLYFQPHSTDTHPNPTTQALDTGKKVALLTFAEEIDAYKRDHNKFPERIPGTLASVMQVEYKTLGINHYQLIMPTPKGRLVLDHQGSHEDIYLGEE